jgi:hypothetical protein
MPVYITALGLTIAVEFFVYLAFIRQKALQLFLYSVLINGLTQPAVYYLYNHFTAETGVISPLNIYFIIIEIVVFLTESLFIMVLFKEKYPKALLISFSANLVTALLSFLF